MDFETFGRIAIETNPAVDFFYGFQGLDRDEETGDHHSQSRYLDSLTGNWTQEDWIGFAGGQANLAAFVGNSPTNWVDSEGRAKKKPINGETKATKVGRSAHGTKFAEAVGGTPEVTLPNGHRADAVKETRTTITVFELKSDSSIAPGGKFGGSKANAGIRQVSENGEAVENPKGKKVKVELWGYAKQKGANSFSYIKRFRKAIPGVGEFFACAAYANQVQAKGVMGGTINTALDAIPLIGTGKAVVEASAGGDLIPNRDDDPRKSPFLPPSIRRGLERIEREKAIREAEERQRMPAPDFTTQPPFWP